ncbi:hypothetical protein EMPG_15556, partial [Blastomyces silverae]
ALCRSRDVLKCADQWGQSWYYTIPLPAYPNNDREYRSRPLGILSSGIPRTSVSRPTQKNKRPSLHQSQP